MARSSPSYRVQVLERAFQILDILAEAEGELGASEIAARVRLHKATTHRLLMALERQRYVERNPATVKFRLGWRLFELGTTAVSRLDLYALARPYVERLVEETGETAHLGVQRGDEIISLVVSESRRSLRSPSTVGRRSPLYCTSQGKAILAFLRDDHAAELIRKMRMTARTPHTLTRPSRLKKELARVRTRGYAVDDEEFEEGLRCIGAPVLNHSGEPVAAISIAGPAFRVGGERMSDLVDAVTGAARQLSAAMGFHRARGGPTRGGRA